MQHISSTPSGSAALELQNSDATDKFFGQCDGVFPGK